MEKKKALPKIMTNQDILDDLDFHEELPCEHFGHISDKSAEWVILLKCPECSESQQIITCNPCKELIIKSCSKCFSCDAFSFDKKFIISMTKFFV